MLWLMGGVTGYCPKHDVKQLHVAIFPIYIQNSIVFSTSLNLSTITDIWTRLGSGLKNFTIILMITMF